MLMLRLTLQTYVLGNVKVSLSLAARTVKNFQFQCHCQVRSILASHQFHTVW